MPYHLVCPKCAKVLQSPDGMQGREIACPDCGTVIDIPILVNGGAEGGDDRPARRRSSLAATSLALGLSGILFGWVCCCNFLLPLGAILYGQAALVQIRLRPDLFTGRGLAVTGLLLGWLGLTLQLALALLERMYGKVPWLGW